MYDVHEIVERDVADHVISLRIDDLTQVGELSSSPPAAPEHSRDMNAHICRSINITSLLQDTYYLQLGGCSHTRTRICTRDET